MMHLRDNLADERPLVKSPAIDIGLSLAYAV